jgi:hypothetical protein
MSQSKLTHQVLANLGLLSLPHDCPESVCPGGFRWLAWKELESAGTYALNTGALPPEAGTMLKAALHKLEALDKAA